MSGKPVGDSDCVLRYCDPATVENGTVTSYAFNPKRDERNRPSVNWVECDKGRDVKCAYDELDRQLDFEPGSEVVMLRVQQIRGVVNRRGNALTIENVPRDDWCCHSEVVEVEKQDRKTKRKLSRLSEIVRF